MPPRSRFWLYLCVLLLGALSASALTLTAPNGGESWASAGPQMITWTAPGLTGQVVVSVNRSYPSGAWEVLGDTTADGGGFLWTVTNPGTLTTRVRVVSEQIPADGDTSDADFTIGGMTVLSPNGGEEWTVGTSRTIAWSGVGFTGNVWLQVNRSYPSGAWITLLTNTPNDGAQAWTVTTPVTGAARIRVRSMTTPSISDVSDTSFAIALPPVLALTSPGGGEAWQIGSAHPITWTSENVSGAIRVDLNRAYPSGLWESLADSTANSGAFAWLVTGPESVNARVRIRMLANLAVGDTSGAAFSILEFVPPAITLTSPAGGENWVIGSAQTITWTSVNVPEALRVQLNRSYPAGTWETLADNVANSGAYAWTPTEPASFACRVCVMSTTNPTVGDSSGGNFYINVPAALALLAPNGGETLVVGSGTEIRWQSTGILGNLTLEVNRTYPVGAWQTLSTAVPNSGVYAWTVSAPVTNTARFRLRANSNPLVGDTSSSDVTIGGARPLTLLAPSGGEVWGVGTAAALRWASAGVTGPVIIDLNRAYPGGEWEPLFASTENDSAEDWTVTGPETATARVRIRALDNPATGDTSHANLSIMAALPAALRLTAPNGVETWPIGQARTVTWTTTNVPGRVRLELNRAYPQGAWESLADSTDNTGSFLWTLTAPTSLAARLRITSLALPSIGDTSDANFFMHLQPGLTLSAPTGGEVWTVGETRAVTWTSTGLVGDVVLEIDRAYPSGNWSQLATTRNDYEYDWTVSGSLSAAARLRIRAVSDPAVADTSESAFTIAAPPSLTLSAPNGGENWVLGTTRTVTFHRYRVSGGVCIELNRAFPTGVWEVLADSTANDSTFHVFVSGAATTIARIRVRAVADAHQADTSDANFTIGGVQAITVVAPNGGETWLTGSQQNITWTSSGITGNVSLEVNRAYPTGAWSTLSASTPNTGGFPWLVTGPATSAARVRVRSVVTPSVGDSSNGDFALAIPVGVTLTSPVGGENWAIGSTHAVTWTRSSAPGNITLELMRDFPAGNWESIVENSAADTSYDWLVSGPATTSARLRLRTLGSPDYSDTSAGNFTLSVPPSITVTAPNGGESWTIGTAHNITWLSAAFSGSVMIQIKPDYPSGNWTTLIPSTLNTGSWLWTVSGPASTTARLRVRSVNNPAIADTSDAAFTLATPRLTLTYPCGGERLLIGATSTLRWTSDGAGGAVRLDLNRDFPSGVWEVLTASTANTGEFPWVVSGPPTATAGFLVRSVTDTTLGDISDAAVALVTTLPPSLALTTPHGGVAWPVGSTQRVEWVAAGITGRVRVALNRSYPTGVWETLTDTAALAGPYLWTVTDPPTLTARIRIQAVSAPAFGDTSNFDFTIRTPQALTLTAPNGGEQWWQGRVYPVTWTSAALVGNVALELNRTYPEGAWTTLVGNTANTGAYNWLISGVATTTARVRVRSLADVTLADTSDADFAIAPSPQITLHAPGPGETWYLGRSYRITWAATNLNELLAVELDRAYPSGGWEMLGEAASTDTSLLWQVTAPATTTARFRVRTTGLEPVADTSNGDIIFRSPPTLTLQTPNGGEYLYAQQPTVVRWTRQGATGLVRVQWDPAYPSVWQNAGTSTADTLPWQPPIETTAARLRILLASDPLTADTSDGDFAVISLAVDERFSGIPTEFSLAAIYPNPFNPTAQIVLGVPRESAIRVRVYDILGRDVAQLYDGPAAPGYLRLSWNPVGLASGTYIVSFEAPNFKQRQAIRYLR